MKQLFIVLMVMCGLQCSAQVLPVCFPHSDLFNISDSNNYLSSMVGLLHADFNNDGNEDVAAASSSQYFYKVGVMLGNGDGTFQPGKFFSTAEDVASSMAAGDFNGDGKTDLAVTYNKTNHVSIFLGNGKGDFKLDSTYMVGKGPMGIITGDFDIDHKTDIATFNQTDNSFTVLYGNGKGKIDTITSFGLNFIPTAMTSDFIRADSFPDIVVAGYIVNSGVKSYVQAWRQVLSPYRKMISGTASSTYERAYSITTGDYDGDGAIDVAVGLGNTTYGIQLFPGAKSLVLGSPKTIDVVTNQQSLITKDVNKDGVPDIIAGNKVLISLKNGSFKDSLLYLNSGIIAIVADFNNDGILDVISGAYNDAISLTLGKGNGILDEGHFEVNTTDVVKFVPEDFDKNGVADLYGYSPVSSSNNSLVVEFRYPTGYVSQGVYKLAASPMSMFSVALDSFGYKDIAVVTSSGFEIWLNNGGAGFYRAGNYTTGGGSMGVGIDINGDGLKDLITCSANGNKVGLYLASKKSPYFTYSNYTAYNYTTDIVAGDFNKDGLGDVAVCNYYNDNLTVFYGQTSGKLTSGTTYSCGKRPQKIKIGDFNGDHIPDLAVSNYDYNQVSVLLGNSSGTFNTASTYNIPGRPLGLYVEDFDKDGYDDICTPNVAFKTRQITVLKGASSGTMKTPLNYNVTMLNMVNFNTGDFNNDGITDMVFGGDVAKQIGVVLGLGNGVFDTTMQIINTSDYVYNTYAVDMNGDNKTDIAFNGLKTGWYLNESAIIGNKKDTFCGSVNLDAGEGYKYKWSTGDTTRLLKVTKSGDYYVSTKTVHGCGATSVTRHIVILDNPHLPNIKASNDTAFCIGDSSLLSIHKYAGETYQWYRNDTALKANTDSFFMAKRISTIKIRATHPDGCALTKKVQILTTTPLPVTVSSVKSTSFCEGDSDILNATSYPKPVKYAWYLDGKPIPGDTLYKTTVKKSGDYKVIVTNMHCSSVSNVITIKVNTAPTPKLSFAGLSSACSPDSVLPMVTVDTGSLISWYQNGSQVLKNTYRKQYGITKTSDIYVIASLSGCTAKSNTVHAIINAAPKANVTVSGRLDLCQGQSVILTQKTDTGLNYTWYKNGKKAGVSSSLTVNDSGSYKIIVKTNGNCLDSSQIYKVTLSEMPVSHITVLGKTRICSGDFVKLQTHYNPKFKYIWQKNGAAITTANDSVLNASQGGAYRLIIKNGAQCADTSSSVNIIIAPLPLASIIQKGTLLQAQTSAGNSYQWYKNDTAISNATGSNYTVTSIGKYYVKVTNVDSCSQNSNEITITTLGMDEPADLEGIMIFPNPGYGDYKLKCQADYTGPVKIKITDALGRVILSSTTNKNSNELLTSINLKHKAKGTYFVTVSYGHSVKVIQLINLQN